MIRKALKASFSMMLALVMIMSIVPVTQISASGNTQPSLRYNVRVDNIRTENSTIYVTMSQGAQSCKFKFTQQLVETTGYTYGVSSSAILIGKDLDKFSVTLKVDGVNTKYTVYILAYGTVASESPDSLPTLRYSTRVARFEYGSDTINVYSSVGSKTCKFMFYNPIMETTGTQTDSIFTSFAGDVFTVKLNVFGVEKIYTVSVYSNDGTVPKVVPTVNYLLRVYRADVSTAEGDNTVTVVMAQGATSCKIKFADTVVSTTGTQSSGVFTCRDGDSFNVVYSIRGKQYTWTVNVMSYRILYKPVASYLVRAQSISSEGNEITVLTTEGATSCKFKFAESLIDTTGTHSSGLFTAHPGDKFTVTLSCYGGTEQITYNVKVVSPALTVKNGFVTENGNTYYYVNDVAATGLITVGTDHYYFDENAVMQTGWVALDTGTYYFGSDGKAANGLTEISTATYYFDADGKRTSGWIEIAGSKHYFKSSGVMATGWNKVAGVYYYFSTSGIMQTGWVDDGSNMYFLKDDGTRTTGWFDCGTDRYYFDTDGVMATGVYDIDGTTYTFADDGKLTTIKNGWETIGTAKYYYVNDVKLVNTWYTIDGELYYFKKNTGKLQTIPATIDGVKYYFNADGTTVKGLTEISEGYYCFCINGKAQTGWQTVNNEKYYFNLETAYAEIGWSTIDEKSYYFFSDGKLCTSYAVIDGVEYYFEPDGTCAGNSNSEIKYELFNPNIITTQANSETEIKKTTLNPDWNKYIIESDNVIVEKRGGGWSGSNGYVCDSNGTYGYELILDTAASGGYAIFKLAAPTGKAFDTANLTINARQCYDFNAVASVSQYKTTGYTDIYAATEDNSGSDVNVNITSYAYNKRNLYVMVTEPAGPNADISDWSALWYISANVTYKTATIPDGWDYDDDDNSYYYQNGSPVTGWFTVEGERHYFYSNGIMAVSTTIDGINLDDKGNIVEEIELGNIGFTEVDFSDQSSLVEVGLVSSNVSSGTTDCTVGGISNSFSTYNFTRKGSYIQYVLDYGYRDEPVTLEISEVHQRTDGAISYNIFANGTKIYTRSVDPDCDGENHFFVQVPASYFDGTELTIKIVSTTGNTFRLNAIYNYYNVESLMTDDNTYSDMLVSYMPLMSSLSMAQESKLYDNLDGFTFGGSNELYYMSNTLANSYKIIDNYVKTSAERNLPIVIGTNSWWGGTPGGADGEGGSWLDLRYHQIVYDPLSVTGYAQNNYQLTTPNRYGSTPWLTMNDDNYNSARCQRLALITEYIQKSIAAYRMENGLEAKIYLYTENEPEYWAFYRHYPSSPNGTADFNPTVVADAAADGVTLDPTNGLSATELKWMSDNLTKYISEVGQSMKDGMLYNTVVINGDSVFYPTYQISDYSFTHTLPIDQFPESKRANYQPWERHIISQLRFGTEWYGEEYGTDIQLGYIASYGNYGDINAERGGVSDNNVRKSALQMYRMGASVYNIYNADSSREYNILSQLNVSGSYADSQHSNGFTYTYKQIRARNLLTIRRADAKRLLGVAADKFGASSTVYTTAKTDIDRGYYNTAFAYLEKSLSESLPARYAVSGTGKIDTYGIGFTTDQTAYITLYSSSNTGAEFFVDVDSDATLTLSFTLDSSKKYALSYLGNNTYKVVTSSTGTALVDGKVSFTINTGSFDRRTYSTYEVGKLLSFSNGTITFESQNEALSLNDSQVTLKIASGCEYYKGVDGTSKYDLTKTINGSIMRNDYIEMVLNENHEVTTVYAWNGNITGTVVSVDNIDIGSNNNNPTVTVNVNGTYKTLQIGGDCTLSYPGLPQYYSPDDGAYVTADKFYEAYFADNLGLSIGQTVTIKYTPWSYNGSYMRAVSITG